MRMTIEQDIKVIRKMLAFTDLSVRANLTADMVDACEDAISTMRKYQKIQEIINNTDYIQEDVIRYKMICEVVEDGRN